MRLRGVLDDGQAVLLGDRHQIRSIAAGWPYRCTGMIATVRGVIAAATASGSRQNVPASMSAKTGVAPTRRTALALAANENDGTMTSSPGPKPSAISESWSADVPEFTATQCRPPTSAPNSCSNAATSGPCTTMPLRSTRTAASISASPITGRAGGMASWGPDMGGPPVYVRLCAPESVRRKSA